MLGGGILLLMVLLPLAIATLNAQERLPQPDPPQVNGRTVSWNAVENAAGYRLRWRQTDQRWSTARQLETETIRLRFTPIEIPAGQWNYVQVQALSADPERWENSPWSEAVRISVRLPPSATPNTTFKPTPESHTSTTPTPRFLPPPENVHLREGYRLCWDHDTTAPYYDYKPSYVTAHSFARPPEEAITRCHDFTNLQARDDELCVSVSDGLRASPWVCRRLDAPAATPRPGTVHPPPIEMAIERSSLAFTLDVSLCWNLPEEDGIPVSYMDDVTPSDRLTYSYTATRFCWHFISVTPGAKLCVVIPVLSERTEICQVVPFPPSPTEVPSTTSSPTRTPSPTFTHTPTYTYTPTATFTPTRTPTITPIPTLPAPTGLNWDPSTNEFSWKKVVHASGIKGTDCSGHYLVKQVMTASEHGTTAPGPPLFFGVKREGYNDIICPEGQDFCLIRWANIVGYENDPENSNTLSVKACGDGVNWADSPFASIKAHETSSYVPPDACTRTLLNHPGYELDYVASPVEFLSSTGNLYCSYYRQYVCTKLDNEDNWASKIIVGDAIRSAFALLADDESASRQSFDVRAEIDRLAAAQIDPSILYVEWEMNAFEIQPTPCYDTSRPFSPPTLGPWAREGQRLVITWTGKGDVYEIRIDGEDSPEAEFYTLSRELPDASYEFFYIRNIPEHTHHTFSIRASYNAIRKAGQVVRAASDWVTLVLKTATPIPSITTLPTSTPWPTATPQGKLGRVTGLRFAPQHITNRLGTLNWDFMVTSGLGYHRDYEVRYRPNETASWLTEPALYYYFELSSVNDWSPYIPWQAQVRAIHADNPSLHGDWSEVITLQALPTPTPSQSPTPLLGNVTHLAFLYDDRLIEGELDPIHLLCVDYDGDLHLPNLWFYVFIDASTYGAFNASVPLDYELRSWLARAANAGDDGHTLLERIEHHDRCATLPDSAIPTINRKRTYCVHAYREDEKSNTLCATASLELIAGTPKPDDP